jgi:DNA-directed RNA polymerase beta' subunit
VNYTKSKYPVYIRDVPNTTQKQLTTTVLDEKDEKIEKKWYKQIDDYNDDVQEYWEMKRQGYLTTKKQQQHDDGFIDFLNTGGGIS